METMQSVVIFIFQIVSSHRTPCTSLIYANSSSKVSFVKCRFLSSCLLCFMTTTSANPQEMVLYTVNLYIKDVTLPLLCLQVHKAAIQTTAGRGIHLLFELYNSFPPKKLFFNIYFIFYKPHQLPKNQVRQFSLGLF